MTMESASDEGVSPRADLWSAAAWIAIGVAIAIGAWRMDRLEHLHINRYEIPGLVPGLLGLAILGLGIALALRAVRRGALAHTAPAARGERAYLATVLAAMLLYTLVLVGHGLPFWLATALFVTGFVFWFDRERQSALGRGTLHRLVFALVCGVATSAIVSLSFQELFYVRLP